MQRFLATGSVRGCAGAVLDPYLNSLHVSLQEQECARLPENDRPRAEIPLEKALREGLEALSPSELQSLLASPTAMENLHFQVWHGTRADRHRSWESIIRHFGTRFA